MRNPKIIRRNDAVKIIKPDLFLRCGYPLSLKDMVREIDAHYGEIIEDLVYSVGKGDKFMRRNEKGFYEDGVNLIPALKIKSESDVRNNPRYEILKMFAYPRLVAKQFGGNQRTIHTEYHEELKDRVTTVYNINFVKTGIRQPSWRSGNMYDGYEYEPPYLENQETHKILELAIPVDFKTKVFTSITVDGEQVDSIFIEDGNVEKMS